MTRAAIVVMILALATSLTSATTKKRSSYDPALPLLGTKFHTLPRGQGRELVEASCFSCHSADLLAQQRLTEKQWTAALDKMIRWGAVVKDTDRPPMIAYLVAHFGPANRFTPIRTRPAGY